MNLVQARARVNGIFAQYEQKPGDAAQLVAPTFEAGKVYEAWVLAHVLAQLKSNEGLNVMLVGGSRVSLRSSRGLLDRSYPHFRLSDHRRCFEVFTDVEFQTMSAGSRRSGFSRGDFHELDIVMTDPAVPDRTRPPHSAVYLAVECKHTAYEKRMLRETLGVRRELSLLRRRPISTVFASWPRPSVPASPPSCLLVYTTDQSVTNFRDPNDLFGLDLEPLAAP